ncbi:MAG: GNAT family N-acetyltransferase [Anaerolineales bacterium]|nr:GNAT family N-acetyltransferase [Anaerolineales bacterium]
MSESQYRTITTKSGLQLRVRELRADDAPHLVEIFEHMSADSRYRRFNQPADHVSEARKWEEAERIVRIVPRQSGGLLAFADLEGEPDVAVAAARYVCVGDGVAEAAISVADVLQSQGVGTQLMRMLAELAKRAGVRVLTAVIHDDNKPIWRVLARLPYRMERTHDGAYSIVELDLTRERNE